MERSFLTILLGLVVVVLFFSCGGIETHVEVLKGNYAFTRGEYQEANIAYLRVLQKNIHTGYISYNLGNVYHALGEPEAAREEWVRSLDTGDNRVLFRVLFNQGVLSYELGLYEEAYVSFRKALVLDPGDIGAKVNLEYCLQKINRQGSRQASQSTQSGTGKTTPGDDVERVLEYIRHRESWETPEPEEPAKELDW